MTKMQANTELQRALLKLVSHWETRRLKNIPWDIIEDFEKAKSLLSTLDIEKDDAGNNSKDSLPIAKEA